MGPTYYVILRIKSKQDFESFGRFCFGNDRECAERVFEAMHGTKEVNEYQPIQLDFIEMVNSVPVSLHIIACTLNELALNIKVMAKEAFKQLNPTGE